MPPPRVHFSRPVVTLVSRELRFDEKEVIYDLEAHILHCSTCMGSKWMFCNRGQKLAEYVKEFIVRYRDGDFYSTRRENGIPVRLEIPHDIKYLLRRVLRDNDSQRLRMRVFYRRVERYRDYSILVIERIMYI